jgi:hypothetical protein
LVAKAKFLAGHLHQVPRLKLHPLPIPAKGVAGVLPIEVNEIEKVLAEVEAKGQLRQVPRLDLDLLLFSLIFLNIYSDLGIAGLSCLERIWQLPSTHVLAFQRLLSAFHSLPKSMAFY